MCLNFEVRYVVVFSLWYVVKNVHVFPPPPSKKKKLEFATRMYSTQNFFFDHMGSK